MLQLISCVHHQLLLCKVRILDDGTSVLVLILLFLCFLFISFMFPSVTLFFLLFYFVCAPCVFWREGGRLLMGGLVILPGSELVLVLV